jgi:hypothetical protein
MSCFVRKRSEEIYLVFYFVYLMIYKVEWGITTLIKGRFNTLVVDFALFNDIFQIPAL